MFNVQQISEKIDELESCLDVEAFEDWFLRASWGHYSVSGDELSKAIAAVHHVLHSYKAEEIDEATAVEELASAIRPFVAVQVQPSFRSIRQTDIQIGDPLPDFLFVAANRPQLLRMSA